VRIAVHVDADGVQIAGFLSAALRVTDVVQVLVASAGQKSGARGRIDERYDRPGALARASADSGLPFFSRSSSTEAHGACLAASRSLAVSVLPRGTSWCAAGDERVAS